MKKSLLIAATALLAVTTNIRVQAQENAPRKDFEARISELNATAKRNPDTMRAAVKGIANETGVPPTQIEAMHKRYPDLGPAALLLSCVMADETKKAPEDFLKHRDGGKSWAEIAKDNRVPLEKLDVRLDHLEKLVAREQLKSDRRR